MIQRGAHYLIPRLDGHVLCGSTLEYVGFDKSTTEQAAKTLHQAALSIWPALAQAPLIQQWSGLRPGSANGIPFIGSLPKQPRVWVNAGQFRNGLVLAPASARLLVDQMLGRTPEIDPAPYQSLG
jgi:glycine oxidase